MKYIDVTFDLETLSLAANAAVLQVAAVAWHRHSASPNIFAGFPPFEAKVDLRSCAMEGFDFDSDTLHWWHEKPQALRDTMASGDCYPIDEVFAQFIQWMQDVKTSTGSDGIMLWAQGSDMDIAILRHVIRKYSLALPLSYRDFRDARTFIIEITNFLFTPAINTALADHDKAYDFLPPFPLDTASSSVSGDAIAAPILSALDGLPVKVHNALYDAARTSWNLHACFALLYAMPSPRDGQSSQSPQ